MSLHCIEIGVAADEASAAARLDAALAALEGERHGADLAVRVEVRLDAVDPLGWLAAVDGPGVAWASRDAGLRIAGRGEALAVRGPRHLLGDGLTALTNLLRGAGRRARAFGGVSFDLGRDSAALDPRWRAFGGFRFAIPAVEVGVDQAGAWMAATVIAGASEAAAAVEGTRGLLAAPVARPAFERQPTLVSRQAQPDRAGYLAGVHDALAAIDGGSVDKVVLARRCDLHFDGEVDAVALLEALTVREPQSYRFCLRPHAGLAFVGASPERLFRRDGRLVASEALAGTRRRGGSESDDERLGIELRASGKDRHEHALVVDAVRIALGRCCDAVEAAPAPLLLRQSRVQHLWTHVRGRLRPDAADAAPIDAQLIDSLHPTPAVCGTPRSPAQSWLAANEGFDRGLYAAPVGWIGDDAAELCVAIRSALVAGDDVSVFAGAGLVAGSEPDAEWREVEGKIAAMLEALGVPPADDQELD